MTHINAVPLVRSEGRTCHSPPPSQCQHKPQNPPYRNVSSLVSSFPRGAPDKLRPRHFAPLPQTGPGPRRLPHSGGCIGRRRPKGRQDDQDTRTRFRLCLCSEGAAGPARIREMGGERSWVPILRCAEGDAALGRPIPRPLGGAASQPSRCGRGVSLLRSGGAHAKADDEGGETEKGMGGLAAPGRCYGTRDAGEVS